MKNGNSKKSRAQHKSMLHEGMPEIASWLLILLFVAITVMGSSLLANEDPQSVQQSSVSASIFH